MSKKIMSLCFSFIIIAGLIYTISTKLFSSERNQLEVVFDEESPAVLDEGVVQGPVIDEEGQQVEYRSIEEEPDMYSNPGEEGHNHNHEQETEVRALNVKAPNFELKTLTGETIRLSDYRGKKVFINFWATWCPPCVEEMPTIQHFYDEYATKENIVILAVNATDLESNVESVKKFVYEYGISFPILLDEKGDVSINYEVLTIPTSMIINEEGMVVEQILGPVTEEMLVSKLTNH